MTINRTYKCDGRDAFSLELNVDFFNGNNVNYSFPDAYIKSIPNRIIDAVANAYVPYTEMADKLLDDLAMYFINSHTAKHYFYPDYLLKNGIVSDHVSDSVIKGQELLATYPRTHYCRYNCRVEFFVLYGMFYCQRHLILGSAEHIEISEFEEFLYDAEMISDYLKLIQTGCKSYTIIEGDDLSYVFLVDENENLLMVIST